MRTLALLATLGLAASAGAAEIPKAYHKDLQAGLGRDQVLVQTLEADLNHDGKPEWIAIGEPERQPADHVSIAIFEKPKGKAAPELIFGQRLVLQGAQKAGAVVRDIPPIGKSVVLVAAVPSKTGDSMFLAQIYGWHEDGYKPMIPDGIDFRSQGGFSIEDVDPKVKGDEIVSWTWIPGKNEQLFDLHQYAYRIHRFDGLRFVGPDRESRTGEKLPNPDAAAKVAGAKKPDLRRQIPRVAEVP